MDSLRSKALGAMHSAGAGSKLGGQASDSSSGSRACQNYSSVGFQGCRESAGGGSGSPEPLVFPLGKAFVVTGAWESWD